MINIGIGHKYNTFTATIIMTPPVGKKPSNLSACGVKTSFANNWKGATGAAWFIATLRIPFAEQVTRGL